MKILKQTLRTLFTVLLLTSMAVGIVNAQPTNANSISFQGALNGADLKPLPNGLYKLTFRFWDGPAPGGVPVSSNISLPSIPVLNGIASTVIPVDASWFNGLTRYLGVSVGERSELLPRVLVTPVPYSLATRGIAVDPPEPFDPPAVCSRPSKRVVIGTTTEDISRIPTVDEALIIGATNGAAGTKVGIYFDTLSRADSAIIVEKNNGTNVEDTSMYFYVGKDGIIDAQKAMTITQDGHVGIGGNPFVYSRQVVGTTDGNADRMPLCHEALVIGTKDSAGAGTRAGLYFDTQNRNGGGIIVEKVNDLPGNEDHRMRFYVTKDGDIDSHNYMTIYENGVVEVSVLRIKGGADLAEHLNVTDTKLGDEFKVESGMVISIDPTGNRKFKLSDEPYDRKRVGIISGGHGVQPGLVLRAMTAGELQRFHRVSWGS